MSYKTKVVLEFKEPLGYLWIFISGLNRQLCDILFSKRSSNMASTLALRIRAHVCPRKIIGLGMQTERLSYETQYRFLDNQAVHRSIIRRLWIQNQVFLDSRSQGNDTPNDLSTYQVPLSHPVGQPLGISTQGVPASSYYTNALVSDKIYFLGVDPFYYSIAGHSKERDLSFTKIKKSKSSKNIIKYSNGKCIKTISSHFLDSFTHGVDKITDKCTTIIINANSDFFILLTLRIFCAITGYDQLQKIYKIYVAMLAPQLYYVIVLGTDSRFRIC